MKKIVTILTAVFAVSLFSGCATWDGVKKDSSKAWGTTKKAANKAYDSAKEVSQDAYNSAKEAVK